MAFGDSAEVLGAIKVEDGDTAIFRGLTCGEGGHLRESEVSSSMNGVFIARSAVFNDSDE